jgi:hypothetical protein
MSAGSGIRPQGAIAMSVAVYFPPRACRSCAIDSSKPPRLAWPCLADQLAEGKQTVGDWERAMREAIKALFGAQYVFGRGGIGRDAGCRLGSAGRPGADPARVPRRLCRRRRGRQAQLSRRSNCAFPSTSAPACRPTRPGRVRRLASSFLPTLATVARSASRTIGVLGCCAGVQTATWRRPGWRTSTAERARLVVAAHVSGTRSFSRLDSRRQPNHPHPRSYVLQAVPRWRSDAVHA